MTKLNVVEQLIDGVQQRVPQITAVDKVGDARWVLTVDEDPVLEISYYDVHEKLTLATTIGQPSEENQAEVHAMLLAFNALSDETGGIVMATATPGGRVIQKLDVFVPNHGVSELSCVVENLLQNTCVWRDIVQNAGRDQDEPSEPQYGDISPYASHAIHA